MRRLMAVVALVLLATACSDPPDSGMVTSREYHAAYSWVQMTCAAYGEGGICSVWVPITHHVPERWALCLRADGHEGCRDVDQRTYDEYLVGEYYPGVES